MTSLGLTRVTCTANNNQDRTTHRQDKQSNSTHKVARVKNTKKAKRKQRQRQRTGRPWMSCLL